MSKLPFGLTTTKPASFLNENKLNAFESAPVRKSAFEKAKEQADAKARKEAAETAAVYEEFVAEYGPEDLENPRRFAKRERETRDIPFDSHDEPNESRRKKRSGASFLNELKRTNKLRETQSSLESRSRSGSRSPPHDGVEPRTLYLSALLPNTNSSTLLDLLKPFGSVKSINILPASTNDAFKRGLAAYAVFHETTCAENAKIGLEGRYLGDGFRCSVRFGKEPSGLRKEESRPFNAKLITMDFSRVAPPSSLSNSRNVTASFSGPKMEIQVEAPKDLKTRRRLHKLVEGILVHGPAFEAILRDHEASNPDYEFLFDNTHHLSLYLRYKLFMAAQSCTPSSGPNSGGIHIFDTNTSWLPPMQGEEIDESGDEGDLARMKVGASEYLYPLERVRLCWLLRTLTMRRGQIARAMSFAISRASAAEEVVSLLVSALFSRGADVKLKLARLFLVSDILHNSSLPIPNVWRYRSVFEAKLGKVFQHLKEVGDEMDGRIRRENYRRVVMSILCVWEGWICFGEGVLDSFIDIFDGKEAELPEEVKMEVREEGEATLPKQNAWKKVDEVGKRGIKDEYEDVDGAEMAEGSEFDVDGEHIDLDGEEIDLDALEPLPLPESAWSAAAVPMVGNIKEEAKAGKFKMSFGKIKVPGPVAQSANPTVGNQRPPLNRVVPSDDATENEIQRNVRSNSPTPDIKIVRHDAKLRTPEDTSSQLERDDRSDRSRSREPRVKMKRRSAADFMD